jgi:hypothetical protein
MKKTATVKTVRPTEYAHQARQMWLAFRSAADELTKNSLAKNETKKRNRGKGTTHESSVIVKRIALDGYRNHFNAMWDN